MRHFDDFADFLAATAVVIGGAILIAFSSLL